MTTTLNPRSAVWMNSDGLMQWFGISEATKGQGGEFAGVANNLHCTEFRDVALATVAASTSPYILDDNVLIPSGARIVKVVVIVTTETTGVNANLDLGLVDQDRATEIDFNGLLAAADIFNAGTDIDGIYEFLPIGQSAATTEGGALLGTATSNTGYVTANYDTAAFTAGVVTIQIYWYK